ncbi:hypothetical protein QR680_003124 [Steinernema hermaphroditum]|uniref:Uncharacterized protein n=1 Tax=Steinernema hermaphroditum TaxID=289476 RepID=A0AA39H5I0_9BILA|nr:hypothetical protein QR680_003124 [Steinernema hermaphroditum]
MDLLASSTGTFNARLAPIAFAWVHDRLIIDKDIIQLVATAIPAPSSRLSFAHRSTVYCQKMMEIERVKSNCRSRKALLGAVPVPINLEEVRESFTAPRWNDRYYMFIALRTARKKRAKEVDDAKKVTEACKLRIEKAEILRLESTRPPAIPLPPPPIFLNERLVGLFQRIHTLACGAGSSDSDVDVQEIQGVQDEVLFYESSTKRTRTTENVGTGIFSFDDFSYRVERKLKKRPEYYSCRCIDRHCKGRAIINTTTKKETILHSAMAEVDDVFVVDRAEYKCCWGYMHVKTGAVAVALLGLAVIIIRFFYLTWILFFASYPIYYFEVFEYISHPFLTLFVLIAIVGIFRREKYYLLPLLFALMWIALFCFFTALFRLLTDSRDALTSEPTVPFLAIFLIAFYTVIALNVFFKSYLYLRDL